MTSSDDAAAETDPRKNGEAERNGGSAKDTESAAAAEPAGADELEKLRLQVEVERLRADAERRKDERFARRGRWAGAVILLVIGALLAPLAVTATWANRIVSDTDRYVSTVSPLAESPEIQAAVADRISNEILTRLDVPKLTNETFDALKNADILPPTIGDQLQLFSGPVSSGIEGFIRDQVQNVVSSEAFARAWDEANRVGHAQLVNALSGKQDGTITIQNGTVQLNLNPVFEDVKARLVDSGFGLASALPAPNLTIVLFQSEDLATMQQLYRALNAVGLWLPIVTLVVLAAGVLVAPNRRRGLVIAGFGVAFTLLLGTVGLFVGRSVYLDALPTDVLPGGAAEQAFDTLVRFLRATMRTGIVLGVVIGIGALLVGPSRAATVLREGGADLMRTIRGWIDRTGLDLTPVTRWLAPIKRWFQLGAVVLAALVFLLINAPDVRAVIVLVIALLLLLAVIELLAPRGYAVDGATRAGTEDEPTAPDEDDASTAKAGTAGSPTT